MAELARRGLEWVGQDAAGWWGWAGGGARSQWGVAAVLEELLSGVWLSAPKRKTSRAKKRLRQSGQWMRKRTLHAKTSMIACDRPGCDVVVPSHKYPMCARAGALDKEQDCPFYRPRFRNSF